MKQVIDMKRLEPSIKEIVGAGGNVKLVVTGQSMMPTLIEYRDSVILAKPGKLKKSDIVLYQRTNGEYVLHRIVKITKNGFGMCGDNQTKIEYPVLPDKIIAVVLAIVRNGELININNLKYVISSFVWTNFISLRPFMLKTVTKIKTRFK